MVWRKPGLSGPRLSFRHNAIYRMQAKGWCRVTGGGALQPTESQSVRTAVWHAAGFLGLSSHISVMRPLPE